MPFEFACSACGKTVQSNESSAGQSVKCPFCMSVIQVPEAEIYQAEEIPSETSNPVSSQLPVIPRPPAAAQTSAEPPEMIPTENRRPCPVCGEMIIATALKCRFCGEIFDKKYAKSLKEGDTKSDDGQEMTVADYLCSIFCSVVGCFIGMIWVLQGKPAGLRMLGLSIGSGLLWWLVIAIVNAMK